MCCCSSQLGTLANVTLTLPVVGTPEELLKHLTCPALKAMVIPLVQGCPALHMTAFKHGEPPSWWPDRGQVPFQKGFTELTKPQLVVLIQTLLDHAKNTATLSADFKRILYREQYRQVIQSSISDSCA